MENYFLVRRPGFTRLNLSFFATEDDIDYILDAVDFVATEGWKFLPLVRLPNICSSSLQLIAFRLVYIRSSHGWMVSS